MTSPFGIGNIVDWTRWVHHQTFFYRDDTVVHVYGKMLALGIDFAAIFNDKIL
jgi:hypothetical protein